MEQAVRIGRRERPCAVCGYDLRATTSGRCPECGAEAAKTRGRSRLPWVHARGFGRVWAYVRTVWLVMTRPWVLAREIEGPVRRRDAVLFARTSMVLATIIATSIIAGLFAYRQNPMPTVDDASYWITPIFALTDTLWGVLPLALSIYVIQWVGLSCLHGILSWGAAPGVARRRASRAAMYVWALAPVEAALMSAVFVGLAIGTGEDAWVDALRGWIIAGTIAAAGVALAITLYAGWVLAIKWGRWKRLRGLMIMGFLPAVLVFQFFVMCVVFWIVGYVAIAIVSMAH